MTSSKDFNFEIWQKITRAWKIRKLNWNI